MSVNVVNTLFPFWEICFQLADDDIHNVLICELFRNIAQHLRFDFPLYC